MNEELLQLSRHMLQINDRPFARYILAHKGMSHRCAVLLGQRGVGKTTTLIQHLLRYDETAQSVLYIPCDHILLGTHTLYDIAEHFSALGGKMIAFDEIHKYTDWAKELKSIYDTFPQLKVLASGSSALEIHKASHDLSRRAIELKLYGMSFREFINLRLDLRFESISLETLLSDHELIARDIMVAIEAEEQKVLALFREYLNCGYYPYFLEFEDEETFWITLEQNIRATLESDLPAIHPTMTGATIKKIKELLIFIAGAVPFTPKWRSIQTILDIKDPRTLKSYFKYLEDAFLIHAVSRRSTKKIYLNNPNQIQAISNGHGNIGNIRETYFMNMLKVDHTVELPAKGDFVIDERYTFEIGGKKKGFEQIKETQEAFVVSDDIEVGLGQRIPLWMFGFLY